MRRSSQDPPARRGGNAMCHRILASGALAANRREKCSSRAMIRTVARLGVIGAVRLAVGRATLADLWDRLAEAYGRRTILTLAEPLALKILTASELTHEDLLDVIAR